MTARSSSNRSRGRLGTRRQDVVVYNCEGVVGHDHKPGPGHDNKVLVEHDYEGAIVHDYKFFVEHDHRLVSSSVTVTMRSSTIASTSLSGYDELVVSHGLVIQLVHSSCTLWRAHAAGRSHRRRGLLVYLERTTRYIKARPQDAMQVDT
ncbi:hypothetical protein BD626DRAFT_231998 [Schizophyllum amplum]|uniref:Uncharacterized protein n=1 Tax=Schizophyllum amplum TaxID=97359 RepID=A0A550BWB9_9AGAR|nr:hypothetical protein BD626DRAFT_231998 [Auriculariopsis ampla]